MFNVFVQQTAWPLYMLPLINFTFFPFRTYAHRLTSAVFGARERIFQSKLSSNGRLHEWTRLQQQHKWVKFSRVRTFIFSLLPHNYCTQVLTPSSLTLLHRFLAGEKTSSTIIVAAVEHPCALRSELILIKFSSRPYWLPGKGTESRETKTNCKTTSENQFVPTRYGKLDIKHSIS